MFGSMCVLIALGDPLGRPAFSDRVVDRVILEEGVDAVLVAGDLADREHQQAHWLSLDRRLDEVGRYNIPTRGNHDDLRWFEHNWYTLPHVVDVCDGVTVITVNTYDLSGWRTISNQIRDRPERRFVILMHEPPITCSLESSQGHYATRWRKKMEELLRPTDLIVAGHAHVTCTYRLTNDVQVLVTSMAGSKRYTCMSDPPGGEGSCDDSEYGSYLRIELSDDGDWTWEQVIVPDDQAE